MAPWRREPSRSSVSSASAEAALDRQREKSRTRDARPMQRASRKRSSGLSIGDDAALIGAQARVQDSAASAILESADEATTDADLAWPWSRGGVARRKETQAERLDCFRARPRPAHHMQCKSTAVTCFRDTRRERQQTARIHSGTEQMQMQRAAAGQRRLQRNCAQALGLPSALWYGVRELTADMGMRREPKVASQPLSTRVLEVQP
ncbi:hypothetical protein BKA63DRAFT_555816 [Paraphoma chrysanthemicola]|nr:hypothetical protein BKA63DRAFT_555816 [Paraphoma chrysanthemicola]